MSDCIVKALDTNTKLSSLVFCLHFFSIIALCAITTIK